MVSSAHPKSADSELTRAILARELTKFQANPEIEQSFQAAFDKVSPSLHLPTGENARALLLESAAHFCDPRLVPWLLKQIQLAEGGGPEKDDVQRSALVAAIKLMPVEMLSTVRTALVKVGTPTEFVAYRLAVDVLEGCGQSLDCYLAKLQEQRMEENGQSAGIKAGYMLAMLGTADIALSIAKVLPSVKNDTVRFVALCAIDRLKQTDTAGVTKALQTILDEDRIAGQGTTKLERGVILEFIYRLRAR